MMMNIIIHDEPPEKPPATHEHTNISFEELPGEEPVEELEL
jgi:hypothetical protein